VSRPELKKGEDLFDTLGRAARRVSGEVSQAEHERGKRALIAALDKQEAERSKFPFGWMFAAAAAAALVLVVLARPSAPLELQVDGAPMAEGGYLSVPESGAPETVRFSDGSAFVFEPGVRGRVADVGVHGARVVVESGRVHVNVRHLPAADWSVQAGPFVIAVTGTEFDVGWSSQREELALALTAGSVIVRGPLAPSGVALHAGQHLAATLTTQELRITTELGSAAVVGTGAPITGATVTALAPAASAKNAVGTPGLAPARSAGDAPSAALSWSRRVASGDFRGVLADAEAGGIEATIASASLADLVALADAARYAGRTDVARKALLAERSRFAGTAEARTAAFLLGRLAEDAQGSLSLAIGFYDQYLAEAPSGAFAAEALGRKMNAVYRSKGAEAARPTAEEYVQRFPKGPYAELAKQIQAE
jgi:hypothetical protein